MAQCPPDHQPASGTSIHVRLGFDQEYLAAKDRIKKTEQDIMPTQKALTDSRARLLDTNRSCSRSDEIERSKRLREDVDNYTARKILDSIDGVQLGSDFKVLIGTLNEAQKHAYGIIKETNLTEETDVLNTMTILQSLATEALDILSMADMVQHSYCLGLEAENKFMKKEMDSLRQRNEALQSRNDILLRQIMKSSQGAHSGVRSTNM